MKTITELEKHGVGFSEEDKINVAEVDDSSGLSPEEGGFSQKKNICLRNLRSDAVRAFYFSSISKSIMLNNKSALLLIPQTELFLWRWTLCRVRHKTCH